MHLGINHEKNHATTPHVHEQIAIKCVELNEFSNNNSVE